MSLYRRINIAFFTTNMNPYGFICANRKKSVCNRCAHTSRVVCTRFKSSFTKYTIIILTLFVSISQDINRSSASYFVFCFIHLFAGRWAFDLVRPPLIMIPPTYTSTSHNLVFYASELIHRIIQSAKKIII